MADTLSVTVRNGDAFRAMLDRIVADVRESREPITAAGEALTPDARAAAPHDSGMLAGAHSGTYAGAGRWRITVDTPYAAVIHWGWPEHGIRRRPWITATWLRHQDTYLDKMTDAQQANLDREAGRL